jgi:hypothetical protein
MGHGEATEFCLVGLARWRPQDVKITVCPTCNEHGVVSVVLTRPTSSMSPQTYRRLPTADPGENARTLNFRTPEPLNPEPLEP